MIDNTQIKPIYFYVANLGSEVQRMFVLEERGNREAMENAYKRAISIINKIKSFNDISANMEMEILRESLYSFSSGGSKFVINRNQMSSYFNPFALRVMNNYTGN